MPTEILTCADCKNTFEFTEKDQAFFAKMNFTKPRRCKACRDVRKAQKNGPLTQAKPDRPAGIHRVEWTNGSAEESAQRGSRKHFRRNEGRRTRNFDDI